MRKAIPAPKPILIGKEQSEERARRQFEQAKPANTKPQIITLDCYGSGILKGTNYQYELSAGYTR